MSFLAAVVQLTTTTDTEASLRTAERLIDEAVGRGARLVVLPENVSFMGTEKEKLALAEPLEGPTFARLSRKAKEHGIHLVAGTLPERGPTPDRAYNTLAVFGPDGQRLAHYRKVHLFDISAGEGATHQESASVRPGDSLALVDLLGTKLGLSICYDLRFAELYRALVSAGAELLVVPAAFTVPTGRDHWEVLLRARAIENECFVLAAAQVGANTDTRRTFGRAMIVSPWGTVLACAPDRPSIAMADIDLDELRELRKKLPCLEHKRPEAYSVRRFPEGLGGS